MRFEWDLAKADTNALKHGVTFDEAGTVFGDVLSVSGRDLAYSVGGASLCDDWTFKSWSSACCLPY